MYGTICVRDLYFCTKSTTLSFVVFYEGASMSTSMLALAALAVAALVALAAYNAIAPVLAALPLAQ